MLLDYQSKPALIHRHGMDKGIGSVQISQEIRDGNVETAWLFLNHLGCFAVHDDPPRRQRLATESDWHRNRGEVLRDFGQTSGTGGLRLPMNLATLTALAKAACDPRHHNWPDQPIPLEKCLACTVVPQLVARVREVETVLNECWAVINETRLQAAGLHTAHWNPASLEKTCERITAAFTPPTGEPRDG